MAEVLVIHEFLKKILSSENQPSELILDVRSPKEYQRAHIPGAVNLPLLDDETRKIIGLTYKQRDKEAAILKGFDLVGKKFGDFIRQVKSLTDSKHIMLYCWRGGLRSNIMSWVLSTGGFKVFVLKGGYKTFRGEVLQTINQPRKVVVVGGKTGCGKTELLQSLKDAGEQTICLETLANHRGSAYGGMGLPTQPRNEMFENMLALELMKTDAAKVLWLENESLIIGSVMLPKKIYELIRTSPMVEVVMSREHRIKRILNEYGNFPEEDLVDNTERLRKRLGGLRTDNAIEAIRNGNKSLWVEEVLDYYDKTYEYGNETRSAIPSIKVEAGEDISMKQLADNVLKKSHEFKLETTF